MIYRVFFLSGGVMNLSKLALLFSVTCSLSVFANETQTIDTELGTFQVKDLDKVCL